MKISKKKLKLMFFLMLLAAPAFLLVKGQLWREITDAQAKRQGLNMPSWAPLVERAQPAVVVISTEATVEHPGFELPNMPAPFRFFAPMPQEKQKGQGSGFIINEDGYVLTNHHVIDGAQKIDVMVGVNPRKFKAKVIGSDEELDIAILKILTDANEKISWPYLPLGNSDELRLGDNVMALGSPMGLLQSVTVGIISYKNRGGIRPSGKEIYAEMIQLQMPINSGNSGCPVMDQYGRVMCVAESIMHPTIGQSISFCLPINPIKQIVPQLLAHGKVEKSFLGVEPTDLSSQHAKALGLSPEQKGVVIMQVIANSPAEKAGLKAGYVILELNGKKVTDAFSFRQMIAYMGDGVEVDLTVYIKGVGKKAIKAKLEKRPNANIASGISEKAAKEEAIEIKSVGLRITNTTAEIQKELNLSANNSGAYVIGVLHGSAASFASIEPNDVIVEVNSELIKSANHLKSLIDAAPSESALLVFFKRGNVKRFVPLEKP